MTDPVRKVSHEAEELHRHCALVKALMDGTDGMRAAGERFLPQWPGEDDNAYAARLATAVLFPAYRRTVSVLTGKPFSKAITVKDDVPPQIAELLPSVDIDGRSLDQFAAAVMQCALAQGFAGILVDMPRNPGARTVAEEREAGMRPYFVQIEAESILGWRTEHRGAQRVLMQLRLLETVEVQDGEFGAAEVEQVRVLEPGKWRTYREVKGTDGRTRWELHEEGATTVDFVPFVPVYGFWHEFMVGRPPMLELAHMNVEHWQSASDQQTILHVARVPILFASGFADADTLVIGSGTWVKASDPNARLQYVEHSGAAIEAGRKSLLDLEERMRQAGAELLIRKPGNTTVAQTMADGEQQACDLQRIVQGLEGSLDAALAMMARWIKIGDTGGHVEIFKDFGAASMSEAVAALVSDMTAKGQLSRKTNLLEMQRRGVLSPDVDVDEEILAIEGERAARQANASPADAGGAPGGNAQP